MRAGGPLAPTRHHGNALVEGVFRVPGLLLGLHLFFTLVHSGQPLLPPVIAADCVRPLVRCADRGGLDRLDEVVRVVT